MIGAVELAIGDVTSPVFRSIALRDSYGPSTVVNTPWMAAPARRYDGTTLNLALRWSTHGLAGVVHLRFAGQAQTIMLLGHMTPRGPRWLWSCPETGARVASLWLTLDSDRFRSAHAMGARRVRTQHGPAEDISIHLQAIGGDPLDIWAPIPARPEGMAESSYNTRVDRIRTLRRTLAGEVGFLLTRR